MSERHWVLRTAPVPDRGRKVRKNRISSGRGSRVGEGRPRRDFTLLETSSPSPENRGVPGSSPGREVFRAYLGHADGDLPVGEHEQFLEVALGAVLVVFVELGVLKGRRGELAHALVHPPQRLTVLLGREPQRSEVLHSLAEA